MVDSVGAAPMCRLPSEVAPASRSSQAASLPGTRACTRMAVVSEDAGTAAHSAIDWAILSVQVTGPTSSACAVILQGGSCATASDFPAPELWAATAAPSAGVAG